MFSNRYLWAILLTIFILLDLVVLKGVSLFGTGADITFILVLFAGLNYGFLYGSVLGFTAGMAKDIFMNMYLGPGTFSMTFTGFLAGVLGKRLFYQNIFIQVSIIFIATLLKLYLTNGLLIIIHHSPYPAAKIFSQAFFNAFLTPPVFFLLTRITQTK